jgi:hypothetical protein
MILGGEPMPHGNEHVFCWLCARLGNPREAALRAGYPVEQADLIAAKLLQRPKIRAKIEECAHGTQSGDLSSLALQGLLRLALGSCNDAVRLALTEEEPDTETLERMDLYCVSEIKRPKGGGCEVKLHNRLEALELLLKTSSDLKTPDGPGSLYAALRDSVHPAVEADKPDEV